jgi:serine/threonine-protein kinase
MMGQAPPTPPGDGERRVLGRYRLTERLASGGSAEVWRARDEQLDRDVAVKLLHPHLLPDERSRDRLAAEARAAAGLSHPGIVGVYDVDTTGEAPAVVFELVDGESLADRLARDGALPEPEAARIAAEIGEAFRRARGQID